MKRVAVVCLLIVVGVAVGAGGAFALLGGRPTEEDVAELEALAADRGRAEGYQQGQAAGILEGEDAGFQRGEAAGYERGLDEGREQGRSEGHDAGYDEGYSAGYQDGQADLQPFLEDNQDVYEEGWQAGYQAGCQDAGGNINIFGECLEPFTLPPIP